MDTIVFPSLQTFSVRSYECDLYGHVNNTVYFRYMQEAVLRVFLQGAAHAGLKVDPNSALHRLWWAEQLRIQYLLPLRYGDQVETRTWVDGVDDAGRRLRLVVDFYCSADGEKVAQGLSEHICRRADGCSEPFPPALLDALLSVGQPAPVEPIPFHPAPQPPPGVFCTHEKVAWQDVNASQQVEPAAMMVFIENCGRQVVAAYHWPMERMAETGFAILLRSNQLEYFQPARLDDELEIFTWVSGVKRATATRHYLVTRPSDGAMLARVSSLGVWVDLKKNLPIRVPPELLDDFAPNIVQ